MGFFETVIRGVADIIRGVAAVIVAPFRVAYGAVRWLLAVAWKVAKTGVRAVYRAGRWVAGIPYRLVAAVVGASVASVIFAAGLAWSAIAIFRLAHYLTVAAGYLQTAGTAFAAAEAVASQYGALVVGSAAAGYEIGAYIAAALPWWARF